MNLKFLNKICLPIIFVLVLATPDYDAPLYLQSFISLGFDSNPLRLSSDEIEYSENSNLLLNSANEVFSTLTTIYAKFSYAPKLYKNRKTRFSLSLKHNEFFNHKSKTNNSININVNQSLGGYKKASFNYYYMPDYYLREYRDIDEIINGDFNYENLYDSLQSAHFSIEKIKFGYEFPIDKMLSKIKLEVGYEKQYYDNLFTEFDLDIIGSSFIFKSSNFSILFNYSNADNSTYLDGSFSTLYMDRSYEQYQYRIDYDKQLKNSESFGTTLNIYNRLYTSNIYNDALHRTRTHIDASVSLWYKFYISNFKNKIQVTFRSRNTSSIFDWVEDLKTFKRYYLTYTIYFNKRKIYE